MFESLKVVLGDPVDPTYAAPIWKVNGVSLCIGQDVDPQSQIKVMFGRIKCRSICMYKEDPIIQS